MSTVQTSVQVVYLYSLDVVIQETFILYNNYAAQSILPYAGIKGI